MPVPFHWVMFENGGYDRVIVRVLGPCGLVGGVFCWLIEVVMTTTDGDKG